MSIRGKEPDPTDDKESFIRPPKSMENSSEDFTTTFAPYLCNGDFHRNRIGEIHQRNRSAGEILLAAYGLLKYNLFHGQEYAGVAISRR